MYNRGSFNTQRFNLLTGQETELSVKETMVETLDSMVSHGEDIHGMTYCIEQLGGEIYVTAADVSLEAILETIGCAVKMNPEYALTDNLIESIECVASFGEDCYLPYHYRESINADVYIGMDTYFAESLQDLIQIGVKAGCNYYDDSKALYEILDCSLSSSVFDYKYITIDVTIPPCGVLIIDSDNYNVLLDNENVIDKQSGDWFDELSRNTFDVTIESGVAGSLSGSLLYTERYL